MRSVALIALAFAMGCTVKEGEAGPGREAGTDEEQGDDCLLYTSDAADE